MLGLCVKFKMDMKAGKILAVIADEVMFEFVGDCSLQEMNIFPGSSSEQECENIVKFKIAPDDVLYARISLCPV